MAEVTKEHLDKVCKAVNMVLPKNTGFILLAMPFDVPPDNRGHRGRLVYASNIARPEAINALKEWLIKCSAEEDWMKDLK